MKTWFALSIGLCLLTLGDGALVVCLGDYYTEPPQFHYTPDPEAPRNIIGRLGPIGLGLELLQPAFTMRIRHVEPGSPADQTGKLKTGQWIESINGEVLKDIDPRVQLGNLITRIEAGDGRITLVIKDSADSQTYPVVFRIPVMGTYSDTWPLNCAKSDKIVRHFASYLSKVDTPGWGAALFMLSTGDERDLAVVRRWFSGKLDVNRPGFPWSIGYTGPAICEYYLRTGDVSVLPAIQSRCDYLKRTIYNGSWMGRGGANYSYMAGGHMNAAGVHALTFLLMAKECGVAVDEHTLQSSLQHFFRFVGRGNVSYGDGLPEGGYTDNGRVGGLAFAMQAAANLTPDGESSIYAKARDISATKSFYSTSWLFHGHTGGGIGELWRGPAMGLVRDKRPDQYRSFMNERRWMYELARTHEGAFGWSDGQNVNYTGINTSKPNGNYIPLIYTLPRQKLRLYGAPPSQYSKPYKLPERPWGTSADDAFYTLEAGEYAPGKRVDVRAERLRTDASKPLMDRLDDNPSDELLLQYALHIDQGIRSSAAGRIVKYKRHHLILPLLQSPDPRGRRTGLQALSEADGKGGETLMNDDAVVSAITAMIEEPEESWWVVEGALNVFANAKPSQIAQHVDRLAYWLDHDEWWLRKAALVAVTPIVVDQRYAQKILPIVGRMIANNERAVALSPVYGIVAALQQAPAEVQNLGVEVLGEAYSQFPRTLAAPGGQDLSAGVDYLLRGIAVNLSRVPGGFDTLYKVSKQRFPDETLPHLNIYMGADPESFGPVVKEAFEPLMRDQLIWQYVAENRVQLFKEIESQMAGKAIDGLVDLYQKLGMTDYNWTLWGPARDRIEWDYITYDPPETKLWERGGERGGRYRPVSWPDGSQDWMNPGFDAATAGWKSGFAPFAHHDGKLASIGGCMGESHFCGCGNPPNTFWEKEVLLMRAEIEFPAMRDGYAYRMLVGGRSHVGSGEGTDVWLNGKLKKDSRNRRPVMPGVGRRAGGRPWGFQIDEAWRSAFSNNPVTVAATGFLPIHKSGVKRNYQTFWFEAMKLPVLGEKEILRSMKALPLLTAAWQTSGREDDKFTFTGSFDSNKSVLGAWEQLGQVDAVDAFDPKIKLRVDRNTLFKSIRFQDAGRTEDPLLYYSGDYLLDLRRNQALTMIQQAIDGQSYLFIEAGGFRQNQMADWTSPFYVFRQK